MLYFHPHLFYCPPLICLQGMSEDAVVQKHFELSDSNRDGQLDSREWLGYMREEDHHLKRDKATRSLRYILYTTVNHSVGKSNKIVYLLKVQN